jgi:carbonic anhydrase/acetyltransferase-like protein (isoleucine patch superfamily)
MDQLIPVRGKSPKISDSCFIAPTAVIIGDTEIGENTSVWFHAVVRGDVNFIRIGKASNIQDGVVIHCTYEKCGTTIGDEVSIGHNAIIHGCTIKDRVLIGMGSIIMDNALVESNTIVAAGAVVLENQRLESGFIYGGIPAKRIKKIDEDSFRFYVERTATNYIKYAEWFHK